MSEKVAIVLAMVSIIGSLVAAAFTGWISFYVEQIKRRSDAKALTNKYRDPLTLSAHELQSRLFNLTEGGLLGLIEDEFSKELVYIHTAFLVGQYLSWIFIFRRQAQFLRFSTDQTNKQMSESIERIAKEFSTYCQQREESAFMLWRGHQMAIGEIMTAREDDGQMYCIGYAAYVAKYKTDPAFRKWFQRIEDGITLLANTKACYESPAANRLRRLQHLLIDLIKILGEDLAKETGFVKDRVRAAPSCICRKCEKTLPRSNPEERV